MHAQRPRLIPTFSLDSAWYNLVHSMYSERQLPPPLAPCFKPISARILYGEGVYKKTFALAPSHCLLIYLNKHAGLVNTSGWASADTSDNAGNYVYDFVAVDYALSSYALTAKSSITVATQGQIGPDFSIADTNRVTFGIPPVGGSQPRDIIASVTTAPVTGSARNGYYFAGGTIAVEAVTDLTGSATVVAADVNQAPRAWGCDRCTQTYRPMITYGATVPTVYDPEVASTGLNIRQSSREASYVGQTVDGFASIWDRISIGGNMRCYAYAQIAGDPEWNTSRGVNGFTATAASGGTFSNTVDVWQLYGEFPLREHETMMRDGMVSVIVMNTGGTGLSINATCTADWYALCKPTLPDYPSCRNMQEHHSPDMSWITTARVAPTAPEAVKRVKDIMKEKVLANVSPVMREVINDFVIPAASQPPIGETAVSPSPTKAGLGQQLISFGKSAFDRLTAKYGPQMLDALLAAI